KIFKNFASSFRANMANPFKYIRDKVQRSKIEELAKKSDTILAIEELPPFLTTRATASLVLRALENMPALVFQWNPAGFNDVAAAPGLRNGVAGQNLAAIITNLTETGATNYGNI
ncbi:10252_t:CDS:2, partial [Paraglomus occultum]